MRWKAKVKPKYREGDKRVVNVFLLFPIKLEDEWRWLELAKIEQEYVETMHYDYGCPYKEGRWVDIRYVD